MSSTYVVRRVERDVTGSLRISSRWHPMPGRVIPIVLLAFIFVYTLVSSPPPVGPLLRWLFAFLFLLLVAGGLFFHRQQRVVFVDPAAKEIVIRDRTRFPFAPVGESRLSFSDIRDVGTVRMTQSDPLSADRIVTLHLGDHDRFLIIVPGRWGHRDLEKTIRSTIKGEHPRPSEDAESPP